MWICKIFKYLPWWHIVLYVPNDGVDVYDDHSDRQNTYCNLVEDSVGKFSHDKTTGAETEGQEDEDNMYLKMKIDWKSKTTFAPEAEAGDDGKGQLNGHDHVKDVVEQSGRLHVCPVNNAECRSHRDQTSAQQDLPGSPIKVQETLHCKLARVRSGHGGRLKEDVINKADILALPDQKPGSRRPRHRCSRYQNCSQGRYHRWKGRPGFIADTNF